MLLLFRNIQFTTAITLAIYVGLLHWAALMGHLQPPPPMADAGLVYNSLFGWANDQAFWSALIAAILVFIQAVAVNNLADSFRLMGDRNWLPGIGYALAASALPEFQFLSPVLVASIFVVFSIWRILETYKSPKSAVLVFDAALWIAVGSLFYPKALLLAIAVFIGIGVMRSWSLRDQIAFFSGIFVPLFLGWIWYFWGGLGSAFRQRQLDELFGLFRFEEALDTPMILKGSLLIFLMLLFVLNFGSFYRNKTMTGQKIVSVLYWMLFISTGILLLRNDWRWEAFVLTAAPAGIFLAMLYQNISNKLAEGLHLFLLGIVVFIQYFPL